MADVDAILNERATTHGDFRDHARVTQRLKGIMTCSPNWQKLSFEQREALDMIQHKIGRILSGNPDHEDHWDDIAGYAKLVPRSARLDAEDEAREQKNMLAASGMGEWVHPGYSRGDLRGTD
jgi:hypothetical protein